MSASDDKINQLSKIKFAKKQEQDTEVDKVLGPIFGKRRPVSSKKRRAMKNKKKAQRVARRRNRK